MVSTLSTVPALVAIVAARSALAKYTGGELRSKTGYPTGAKARCIRVEWRAKPAIGNCVITLFSLFNGDLTLGLEDQTLRPPWSEIAIETFGGSAGNGESQFQTQFISQKRKGFSRKKQHLIKHRIGEQPNVTNIFDEQFHTFAIEFCLSHPQSKSLVSYSLDGTIVRIERGGHLNHLVPPLDIYTSTWLTKANHSWACTSDEARPDYTVAVVEYIRVYEDDRLVQHFVFENESDLHQSWDISDWGFRYFDGVYDPRNIYVFHGKAFFNLLKVDL